MGRVWLVCPAAPNQALEPTPNSLRSSLAAALGRGSPRAFGGGLDVAHVLARANIVTNKNLLPSDTPRDWDRPSGLRLGTIEVTRLGMREKEMDLIADFMARVLVERLSPDTVIQDVVEFRQGYQTLYYNFDHALPPQ